MTLAIIFVISGLLIVLLLITKKWSEKRKSPFFILRLISKGDIRTRELYHKLVHIYSRDKERVLFLLKKRVPMRSRNSLNKSLSFLKDKRDRYANRLRNSKILGKSDGISEFFKNMSEIEKGNGEIHDSYEDSSQNTEEKVK